MNSIDFLLKSCCAALLLTSAWSCIEDGYATSPSAVPEFSVDSLFIDDIFTGEPTPTSRFVVYNRNSKILNLSHIGFRNPSQQWFRVNVDGRSGREFDNVEIRPNDSIFVFVEATVAPTEGWDPVEVGELLDFTANGRTLSVTLVAAGNNVERITGATIASDTTWLADHRRQIFDSLIVAPGATLRIEGGSELFFHDDAFIRVDGTLLCDGTADAAIDFRGDRRGNVAADIPFDLMASQWRGIVFSPTSRNSRLSHTIVRNTSEGVRVDSLAGAGTAAPALELLNCRLRNSAGYVLDASHSSLRIIGCELADASSGVVRLTGGSHEIAYTTIANYYLFTALGGPALQLHHHGAPKETPDASAEAPLMNARFTNSIIYGNGSDINYGDLTGTDVSFTRCLLRSNGENDDNFIDCIWGENPMYYTDRPAYIFDYRLRPESPAASASDPMLEPAAPAVDPSGAPRPVPASLGAYEVHEAPEP